MQSGKDGILLAEARHIRYRHTRYNCQKTHHIILELSLPCDGQKLGKTKWHISHDLEQNNVEIIHEFVSLDGNVNDIRCPCTYHSCNG